MKELLFDQLSSRLARSAKESREASDVLFDIASSCKVDGFIVGEHFDGQFWGMDALQTLVPLAVKGRPQGFTLGTGSILSRFHDGAEVIRRAAALMSAFDGEWEFGIGNGYGGVSENQNFSIPQSRQLARSEYGWETEKFGYPMDELELCFRKDSFSPPASEERWCYPGFIRPPSSEVIGIAQQRKVESSVALRCLWQDDTDILRQEIESLIGTKDWMQSGNNVFEGLISEKKTVYAEILFKKLGIIIAPPLVRRELIRKTYKDSFDRIFVCPVATNLERYFSCSKSLLKEGK